MASAQNLAGLAALAALGAGVYTQRQRDQAQQAASQGGANPNINQDIANKPLSDPMFNDYEQTDSAVGAAGTRTIPGPGGSYISKPIPDQPTVQPVARKIRSQVSPAQMQQYEIANRSNMGQFPQDQRGNFPGQGISYLAGGQGRQGGPDPTSYSPPQDRGNFPGQGISYLAGGQGRQGGADTTVPKASPTMPQDYSRTGGPSFEDLRNYQAEKEQDRMLAESRKKAPTHEEQLEKSKKNIEKAKELIEKLKAAQGKKTGGSVKKMAKGGISKVNKSSNMSKPMSKASSRGDGIASKGKTKGRFV